MVKSRLSFLFILFSGLLLSAVVSFQLHHSRTQTEQEVFNRIAREQFLYASKSIDWHIGALRRVGDYFNASESVSEHEFGIYTAPLIDEEKSYDAIGWIEAPGEETEKSINSYVIDHLSSRESLPHALGYKIAQDPYLKNMVEQALEKKQTIFFYGEPLILKDPVSPSKSHFVVIHPVVHDSGLRSFTFSKLNIQPLVERPQEPGFAPYIALTVSTTDEYGKRVVLYQTHHKGVPSKTYKYVRQLQLNGLLLNFEFDPTQLFLETHRNYQGFLMFILLALLSTGVAFYMEHLHRHVQQLQEANMRASEADRIKNEFMATMSHEIRSPMTGILGMSELLLDGELPDEQRNYARTILTSAESLLTIINDILDFSRIESNRLDLEIMPINMLELVDDICALHSIRSREKAIELAVRYVPGTEQFVYADPTRLRQILGNLINNAIKFTQRGSVIVTVRENRDAIVATDMAELVFEVEDTGYGIDAVDQKRIFDKFVQLDSSSHREIGGMGLGLAICKRLSDLMQGRIGLESVKGKGSTFSFTVQLRRNRDESYAPVKPIILKDMKVLIVDDLPTICTVVCEQLNLAGMRCASASSGGDALEMMRAAAAINDPYRIVLIDYLMADMDGEALARAISDLPEMNDTCLIMMTGAGIPVVPEDFVRKGFSAHISKPVKGRLLVEALATIWRRFQDGEKKSLIRIDSHAIKRFVHNDHPILQGAHVLLAEDSRINQAFAEDTLGRLGCQITIVPNGQEAVKAVMNQKFDLVLMDCQMPVMDGFEATRRICDLKRSGHVAANLPIVALTANSMKGDRERCQDAGMDDYLAKPVRSRELKEKVHYWITRTHKSFASDAPNVVPFVKAIEEAALDDGILDPSAATEARRILKDRYGSVLIAYIEDTENYIRDIDNAMAQKDIESAIRPAHTIKSSSRHMGAAKLASEAEALERALRMTVEGVETVQITQLHQKLNDMTSVFERTREAFQKITA